VVVVIEAGNGIVGLGLGGFFLKGKHAAVPGKLNDTVGLGIGNVITEDGGPGGALGGAFERRSEVMAIEKVVTEDEGRRFPACEETGVAGDVKGLGETIGAGLFGVAEFEAELGPSLSRRLKRGRSVGVEITSTSRMPESMSTDSG
jgi:hypothetical protein